MRLILNGLAVLIGCAGGALSAHQVPNLTLEADFKSTGEVEFRLNLDPRLFLSEDPRSMPPVPAPWFRDQPEEEKRRTLEDALGYVKTAVTFFFDGQAAEAFAWEFKAIDGATGEALADDTLEVHLLATVKTRCPAGSAACSVRLEMPAKAPAVLLNRLDDQDERQPQILFPGETSRPFRHTVEAHGTEAVSAPEEKAGAFVLPRAAGPVGVQALAVHQLPAGVFVIPLPRVAGQRPAPRCGAARPVRSLLAGLASQQLAPRRGGAACL